MSTHPPISPSLLPTTPAAVSPVHLPAPRPVRFASYHGPLPVSFQLPARISHDPFRPTLGQRSHSFSPDNLRTAFASLNFVDDGSAPSDASAALLTPAPSSPPDYLLELLSILQPRPTQTQSAPTSSLNVSTAASSPPRSITPPPRPAAPAGFRHRRHPSATSLLLEDTAEPGALASKGRKGTEVPYWVPSQQARETTRKKRSQASLRRSASAATSSSSAGGSPPHLSFPLASAAYALSATPGGSTPISPLPITPAFPTPVSIEADVRVLGLLNLSGFPFPVTPRTECAPFVPAVAEGPAVDVPAEDVREEEAEEAEMEDAMSPRAFLYEEMRAETEAIAARAAAAEKVHEEAIVAEP